MKLTKVVYVENTRITEWKLILPMDVLLLFKTKMPNKIIFRQYEIFRNKTQEIHSEKIIYLIYVLILDNVSCFLAILHQCLEQFILRVAVFYFAAHQSKISSSVLYEYISV